MDDSKLGTLMHVTRQKLLEHSLIFCSCKDVRDLLTTVFDKMNEPYEVKTHYVSLKGREWHKMWHTWVEIADWLIETNPSQIWDMSEAVMRLPLDAYKEKLDIRESGEESIWNYPVQEWAVKFYGRLADEIVADVEFQTG